MAVSIRNTAASFILFVFVFCCFW